MSGKNSTLYFSILFSALAAPFLCFAQDAPKPGTYFNIDKGCGIIIKDAASGEISCKAWQAGSQVAVGQNTIGMCLCNPDCLNEPANYYYYDNPAAKHKQTNTASITLPTVLAWDNVTSWQSKDGNVIFYMPSAKKGGTAPIANEAFGAQSYLLEIDNAKGQLGDKNTVGKVYRKILTTTEFNATSEIFPCFFNSDTVIRWRVRPCCKADGKMCMPEKKAAWQEFRTSPAPEPVWPKDPDWTGSGDAKNVSFGDIELKWCQAKVSPEKLPYNDNMGFSQSYQMRVYTNENKIVLTGKQIPAQFSDLAQWLQKDVPALASPLACHYLEKQQNNTCKPDVVNPIQVKTVRNDGHFYYWSHKLLPNSDRALFTKNLTYYWQLRRCFNNPNAGDESCNNSDSNKGWGQLWAFTTKNDPVAAPAALAPQNDVANYNNSQLAKLAGLPVQLQWTAPNGANSFAYDIQKISGATGQSLVSGERRTTKSQIFFAKNGSSGDAETQGIELELDTPYKWRVKSCWPALPVGDVCDSAWSGWNYFRTTGRAPKTGMMKPENAASNISLPVSLQWEAVPGAKSYILTFNGEKITTTENQYTIDYPKVGQNQIYAWKAQTCAAANGTQCGGESAESSFMTAAIGASQNPITPAGTADNSQLIYNFSWAPVAGAHYYKFVLNYAQRSDKETNGGCKTGKKVEKIVKDSSVGVNKSMDQLFCLGKYDWSVLACLDQACADKGAEPQSWQFDFIAGGKEIKKGAAILAVCGITNDNPNTAWDDREACGAKHLLLTVEQIINLILFRVSFILIPILLLATGAMYYTQFGGPELIGRVKSWWKLIGIGYALLFFAWTLTGIFLTLFGYRGVWWSI